LKEGSGTLHAQNPALVSPYPACYRLSPYQGIPFSVPQAGLERDLSANYRGITYELSLYLRSRSKDGTAMAWIWTSYGDSQGKESLCMSYMIVLQLIRQRLFSSSLRFL